MNYVEATITPDRGWFHPVDELVKADPNVRRKTIQQLNYLDDGTVVMLYEVAGEHEYIETMIQEYFEALSFSTSKLGENILVWIHINPSSLVDRLLRTIQEHNLILRMPMEFTRAGGVTCVFVGDETTLREATSAIPDDVNVDIRRLGEYDEGLERFAADLTERQVEVLDAAIDLGYYDDPRKATYEDIANMVDCSKATVGRHLRIIESLVMPELRP